MHSKKTISSMRGQWFTVRQSVSRRTACPVLAWVAVFLACRCPSARAQDTNWTASGDGFWTNSASWSAGAPANNPAVYITNALSKTVTTDANTPRRST